MPTYAVGDIQGCLEPLKCLLQSVEFDPQQDQLWSAGDVVNRGPQSLQTLRFLYDMRESLRLVLGNHDLHLLAIAEGIRPPHRSDTFEEILQAPDRDQLLDWLRHQPLVFKQAQWLMVHAGIPHNWSTEQTLARAAEVEQMLRSDNYRDFLQDMYGNEPAKWNDVLTGTIRARVITNYLTRMRFCAADGTLDLNSKAITPPGPEFLPWFEHGNKIEIKEHILFGHWAALEGKVNQQNHYALDTGCVWGRQLSMLRLEDRQWFRCECGS